MILQVVEIRYNSDYIEYQMHLCHIYPPQQIFI